MQMYPSPEDIIGQFKELCAFAGHVSRQIVQEVRVRAAKNSPELAAQSICTFFVSEKTESRGWILLSSARYIAFT